jgi:hypothetical protein
MSEDINNSNNKRKAADVDISDESEPPSKAPKISENEKVSILKFFVLNFY